MSENCVLEWHDSIPRAASKCNSRCSLFLLLKVKKNSILMSFEVTYVNFYLAVVKSRKCHVLVYFTVVKSNMRFFYFAVNESHKGCYWTTIQNNVRVTCKFLLIATQNNSNSYHYVTLQ